MSRPVGSASGEPLSGGARTVGDDHRSTRAYERRPAFGMRLGRGTEVLRGEQFDGRELAAHVVHRPWLLDARCQVLENVEVGHPRLDHQDVSAFLRIAQRARVSILGSGRIDLVRGPVLEPTAWRGVRSLAEWP